MGLVSNIYKGSFVNLAAKGYPPSGVVGLGIDGRDWIGKVEGGAVGRNRSSVGDLSPA